MKLDRQFRKATPEEEADELMAQFNLVIRQVQEREAIALEAAQAAGARPKRHTGVIARSIRPPRTRLYNYWRFTRRLRIVQDLHDINGSCFGHRVEPHLWLEVKSHNNGIIFRRISANMYPDIPIDVKHVRVDVPTYKSHAFPHPDLSKMFGGDWTNAAFRYDHDHIPAQYHTFDNRGIVARAEVTLPSKLEDYKYV